MKMTVIALAPIKLDDVMLVTKNGYALRFNIEEVPVIGAKAAGVKAINLKKDDACSGLYRQYRLALPPDSARFAQAYGSRRHSCY